jgi:hypothetical protein
LAESKAASSKGTGKGLSKKVGPLPVWGWGAAGVSSLLIVRYLRARSSANASVAANGTTGDTLTPSEESALAALEGAGTTSSATSSFPNFSSTAQWFEAGLEFLTGNGVDAGDAYNGLNAYLNGNCVSQAAYTAISQMLASTSVGLPPGFSAPPTLSVCASPVATSTNPSPAASTPAASILQEIDASAWPQIVKFGTDANAGTDFVPIGVVNNGVYSGKAAKSGAPVWAGVLGGYAQGTNFATLPNGTVIYGASTLNGQGYYS